MVPKSKICRDWLQEKCTNGEQCGYAHQKDEAPSIAKSTKSKSNTASKNIILRNLWIPEPLMLGFDW
jgi:hypothetical protein